MNGQTGNAELDWLYHTVARLAQQAQLPMPEVGVLRLARSQRVCDRPEQAARASSPCRRGLLRTMRQEEVEGVLAHEVAHIQNGDMVTMTLIQGVVNAFVHVPGAHHRVDRPADAPTSATPTS